MSVQLSQYGPNATSVTVGGITFYFSYETCVAYHDIDEGWVISENIWSTTTGRHLNLMTPKTAKRVPHEDFKAALESITTRVSVA